MDILWVEKLVPRKVTEIIKTELIVLFQSFQQISQKYTLFVMLENPKINRKLIYNYRGIQTNAPYNTSGWNSVYVAGKIIEKIGPILAINNKEFVDLHVSKKFN